MVSHALTLEAEFRNLTQGDMSILDYCQCLKSYANALANVDQPVGNPTLVPTLLRGLKENYHDIASIIKTREPLPTFLVAHSLLTMEEADLKIRKLSLVKALVASNAPPPQSNQHNLLPAAISANPGRRTKARTTTRATEALLAGFPCLIHGLAISKCGPHRLPRVPSLLVGLASLVELQRKPLLHRRLLHRPCRAGILRH
jgi:hypothetical protein